MIRALSLICWLAALVSPGAAAQSNSPATAIALQVIPRVERAVGLKFKRPPTIATRSSQQVHAYLSAKLDQDQPPEVLEQITTAYRLFGLIPDTLDVRSLLLSLYSEQVVGYFDPDSATLYVVERADPAQLRLVLAHELVHALQDQYVPLDSLLSLRRQNDRRNAIQAVMEGQATLASVAAILPDQDVSHMPDFWNQYRETVREQQQQMPVFRSAPLIIREGLIFPYLAGADFARWFSLQFPDTVPFGRRLPLSTEQILHTDRYLAGDRPVDLRFARGPKPIYDDNLGEFEIRVLLTILTGREAVGAAGAMGWGGDRYGVFGVDGNPGRALVWWSVWDTETAAKRVATLLAREWPKRAKSSRKFTIEQQPVDSYAGVRLVDAPPAWKGWQSLPTVTANETVPPGVASKRNPPRTPRPVPVGKGRS
jgi:hypothetical protein